VKQRPDQIAFIPLNLHIAPRSANAAGTSRTATRFQVPRQFADISFGARETVNDRNGLPLAPALLNPQIGRNPGGIGDAGRRAAAFAR